MRAALLLLALAAGHAQAQDFRLDPWTRGHDVWLSVMTRSYHADRSAGYNERNWGVGIEYGFASDWRVVAGTYENSVFRRSNYAGVHWAPFQWFGGIAGAVSGYPGYEYRWGPMVAPVLSWERGRAGVNVIALPNFGEVSAVVTLQINGKF